MTANVELIGDVIVNRLVSVYGQTLLELIVFDEDNAVFSAQENLFYMNPWSEIYRLDPQDIKFTVPKFLVTELQTLQEDKNKGIEAEISYHNVYTNNLSKKNRYCINILCPDFIRLGKYIRLNAMAHPINQIRTKDYLAVVLAREGLLMEKINIESLQELGNALKHTAMENLSAEYKTSDKNKIKDLFFTTDKYKEFFSIETADILLTESNIDTINSLKSRPIKRRLFEGYLISENKSSRYCRYKLALTGEELMIDRRLLIIHS